MASLLQMLGDFPRVSDPSALPRCTTNSRQRLAAFLDQPGFPWKKLILGFSVGQFALEGLLSLRQYKVLQRTKPPKALQEEISQETFDKSQVYQPNLYGLCQTDNSGIRTGKVQVRSLLWSLLPDPEHPLHSI